MTHFTGKVNRYAEACATLDCDTSFSRRIEDARTAELQNSLRSILSQEGTGGR